LVPSLTTALCLLAFLQRRALLGITGAYRTTSTAALQVLAGVPPLDLELKWLVTKEEVKQIPANLRAETLNRAAENLLDTWQSRWRDIQKGRWTYQCFPDIRHRLKLPLALGHEVTQFLTEHGHFRAKLNEVGLQPSPLCPCGIGNEDVEHVLYECPIHDIHRAQLVLSAHRAGFQWPTAMTDLVSGRETYAALVRFSKLAAYFDRPQAAV